MSLTEAWRFLDLGAAYPFSGAPLQETLVIAREKKLIPNTLCFLLPGRFVGVSRRTNIDALVNREYCRREKIPIIRYMGEGGVGIWSDNDMIQYSLVFSSSSIVDSTPELSMKCVAKGLQLLGLNAYPREGSNDVLIGNRKISGHVNFRRGDISVFGGSVVLNFDYDFCENALLPMPEKFVDKEAKNHREWMTTLKAQLGREPSVSEVVSALKRGFESVLQVEFEVSNSLTEAEKQILAGLQEKYHSESWLKTGRWSPVKDYWRPK